MIKKLRLKFIKITMISVFAVLFLIVVTVNLVNIHQNNESADFVTWVLLENDGRFGKEPRFAFGPKGDFRDPFRNREEMPFSTRFFIIRLDAERGITGYDLERIASVSESDIETIAKKIPAADGAVGWYGNYRYRTAKKGDGYIMIIMDATSNRSAIFSVLWITVIVGAAAFLAVFVLVVLLSGRAIKPISETYEKQKRFITDAGHELKTPLTVISANAEVLGMTYGENEWLDGINRQSEHMRSLIVKMIQMSKLDEGGQTLTFENFSLSDAVYDTAMSFSGIAGTKGLTLSVNTAPDIFFRGDEAEIRQAVSILVDNAVKYCDNGGKIEVSLYENRKKIFISVINSFKDANLLETDKLFERFYRADQAHTSGSSFGLGLSIAKSVAELHGGSIKAEAADGDKVRFSVELRKG